MALQKDVVMDNGLILSYHRINTVTIHTNNQNIIEVTSYLNEKERQKEKDAMEKEEPFNIYTKTTIYVLPYDKEFSVVKAYEYLKTLEQFQGSIDV